MYAQLRKLMDTKWVKWGRGAWNATAFTSNKHENVAIYAKKNYFSWIYFRVFWHSEHMFSHYFLETIFWHTLQLTCNYFSYFFHLILIDHIKIIIARRNAKKAIEHCNILQTFVMQLKVVVLWRKVEFSRDLEWNWLTHLLN